MPVKKHYRAPIVYSHPLVQKCANINLVVAVIVFRCEIYWGIKNFVMADRTDFQRGLLLEPEAIATVMKTATLVGIGKSSVLMIMTVYRKRERHLLSITVGKSQSWLIETGEFWSELHPESTRQQHPRFHPRWIQSTKRCINKNYTQWTTCSKYIQ